MRSASRWEVVARQNRTTAVRSDSLTEIAGGSSEVNQKAKQLQMLLAEKNAADYSIRQPGRDDAERAVKRAKAFHGWSKRQVESATGSG